MGKIGLLVLTNPMKLTRLIPSICAHVRGTLYVQYLPLVNGKKLTLSKSSEDILRTSHYSKVVNEIYCRTSPFHDLDVRVLIHSLKNPKRVSIQTKNPIEVLIFDQVYSQDEINSFVEECASNLTEDCRVVTNENDPTQLPYVVEPDSSAPDCKIYDNVVLGGTFDRLHNGHKILLSEAVFRCKKLLTVGVTDTVMIQSKILWELIHPCSQRINSVKDFLQDVDSSLKYNVVPIEDPFGPTKEDPSFEMLVVSTETHRGGLKVNEERARRGLPQLDVHTVHLLELEKEQLPGEEEERKLSSSNSRLRLLGTRLRTPSPRPNLPSRPYVLGVTGGIASGKSSLCGHLRDLGAGVVECDKLAHTLYAHGQPLHRTLVHAFGEGILAADGEIDRQALGSIVFNDKGRLEQLNGLVWPALLEKAREAVAQLWLAGHQVVSLEAAVLLQAGWQVHCHEVWGCIVPPHQAMLRLRERSGLSEDEAKRRLSSQPTNSEVVSRCDVVFCPAWSIDFTRRQVLRAWERLLREQPSLL